MLLFRENFRLFFTILYNSCFNGKKHYKTCFIFFSYTQQAVSKWCFNLTTDVALCVRGEEEESEN